MHGTQNVEYRLLAAPRIENASTSLGLFLSFSFFFAHPY